MAIGVYSFGNGVIRGVAAMTVWMVALMLFEKQRLEIPWKDLGTRQLLLSLWEMPTTWETHGDGSERACVVAQMARQNQAAEVQPVSTLQWIQIVVGRTAGFSHTGRRDLLDKLRLLSQDYESHPDVAAYDEVRKHADPAAKRRRTSTKAETKKKEEREEEAQTSARGIRMGNRKITAIKNFISGGTEKALKMIISHAHRTEWRHSCVSDDILAYSFIYVGSNVPSEYLPESAPMPMAATPPEKLSVSKPFYNEALSEVEFCLLWEKAMSTFAENTSHLEIGANRARFRATARQWCDMRCLVQFWHRYLQPLILKDLPRDEAKEFEEAMMRSSVLDAELLILIERQPSVLHVGMLSDQADKMMMDTSQAGLAIQTNALNAARSRLTLLESMLKADWKTIADFSGGAAALADLLVWLENQHLRTQTKIGEARGVAD